MTISWSFCFEPDQQLVYAIGIYSNERLNIRNLYNISTKYNRACQSSEGFFMLEVKQRMVHLIPASGTVKMQENELYGVDFRLIGKLNPFSLGLLHLQVFKNRVPEGCNITTAKLQGWLTA